MTQYSDEEVFDTVLKALMSGSKTLGEVHSVLNFVADAEQVDDALDILEEVGALNERQEPRPYNEGKAHRLISVYEIRGDHKTKNAMKEYRARQEAAGVH